MVTLHLQSDNTPGTQAGIQCAVLHVHILYARDIPDPTGGGSVKSNTLAAKYVTDVRKVYATRLWLSFERSGTSVTSIGRMAETTLDLARDTGFFDLYVTLHILNHTFPMPLLRNACLPAAPH